MSNDLVVKVHNVETGEVIEREMTAAELKQLEADRAADELRDQQEAAKIAQKQALLSKLGITEQEAKLLLG